MPIWFIVAMVVAFGWLGYETKWLTIRLPQYSRVGSQLKLNLPLTTEERNADSTIVQWLRHQREIDYRPDNGQRCPMCREWGQDIVHHYQVDGCTFNVCEVCSEKIAKQIAVAQSGKPYKVHGPSYSRGPSHYVYGAMEISFDGKPIGTVSAWDKPAKLKLLMSEVERSKQ